MPKRPPAPPASAAVPQRTDSSVRPETDIVELSRFRADLSRGKRQRRAEILLGSPDPRAAIRALAPDEFYYALSELGFPEATELLRHGSVPQVRTALDFALWNGDQVDMGTASVWLEAMADAPAAELGQWAQGLDIELVALLLRGRTRVHDLSLEGEPDEPEGPVWMSPDRLFGVELLGDDTDHGVSQELLEKLYRYDRHWMRRILVGTRSELDSELEEHAYRWRSGRMADLGFEEHYAALEVYRELDPASVKLGEVPAPRVRPLGDEEEASYLGIPAPLAERLSSGSPFARAVSGVRDKAELGNLETSLRMLSNRVLAADKVTPGDEPAVAASLERMVGTLDMAVELLSRGVPDDAVRAVSTIPLVRLHQLGTSLVGKIRRLAITLRKHNPYAHLRPALDVFESQDAELLASATRLRPLYPQTLDSPPAGGERPFSSLTDLRRMSEALEAVAAAVTLLHALGVRPEHLAGPAAEALGDPAALDAGMLARTVLARTLIEEPAEGVVPLDPALAKKLELYLKDVTADPALRERAEARLHELLAARWPTPPPSPGARTVMKRWVDGLLHREPVLVR